MKIVSSCIFVFIKGSQKTDSEKETEIDEKQLHLSGFNDAKSLLIQNDILLKLDENPQQKCASTGKSAESMDIVPNLDHSRSQHSALDSVNVLTACENQTIDHAGDYAPLNTNKLKLMTCKKFFHCQQTEQNKHHVSSCIIVANEVRLHSIREIVFQNYKISHNYLENLI